MNDATRRIGAQPRRVTRLRLARRRVVRISFEFAGQAHSTGAAVRCEWLLNDVGVRVHSLISEKRIGRT